MRDSRGHCGPPVEGEGGRGYGPGAGARWVPGAVRAGLWAEITGREQRTGSGKQVCGSLSLGAEARKPETETRGYWERHFLSYAYSQS